MKGDLDYEEFRFFLTGGISLGGDLPPIPASWISEKSWGEINRISELKGFKGFLASFTKNHEAYKGLYDSPAPQEFELKEGYYQKLSAF